MLTLFSKFLVGAPSPSAVSLDVPGVTPLPCHTFFYGILFVFAIFLEHIFYNLFFHMKQ